MVPRVALAVKNKPAGRRSCGHLRVHSSPSRRLSPSERRRHRPAELGEKDSRGLGRPDWMGYWAADPPVAWRATRRAGRSGGVQRGWTASAGRSRCGGLSWRFTGRPGGKRGLFRPPGGGLLWGKILWPDAWGKKAGGQGSSFLAFYRRQNREWGAANRPARNHPRRATVLPPDIGGFLFV
jgi:hypothetical protein